MSQLDVPTISFTHYLDLLRRRTWHVVIISVLGLVVGGVVAMLVPRYYVAQTTIELTRPVLDPTHGSPQDPMSRLISAAKITVPAGVKNAVRELGWADAFAGSAEEQRAYLARLKANVGVYDLGPANKGRQMAHLMISFKDLNGARAAAMANELRRQWLDEVVMGLKDKADQEVLAVVQQKQNKQAERRSLARQLQLFEEENGINPELFLDPLRRGMTPTVSGEIRVVEREIGRLKSAIRGLERKIQARQTDLEGMSPTIRVVPEDVLKDPAIAREYRSLGADIIRLQKILAAIKPAHQSYSSARETLNAANSRMAELKSLAGGESPDKENPDFARLTKEVRGLKIDKGVLEDELIDAESRLASLNKRAAELPAIYAEYDELRTRLDEAKKLEEIIAKELEEKKKLMGRIRPYRLLTPAHQPPAPTEPNPYVLAMMGCLVGLGLAIGVVLLIDFMQMSFKSVSDVESGLGLPVLGSMSYLETEEEADATRDRRRIAAVFSVLFLVLILTIVTIYYLNKTSLPAFVTGILDMILGDPK